MGLLHATAERALRYLRANGAWRTAGKPFDRFRANGGQGSLALALLAFSAAAQAAPVTVPDHRGRMLTLAAPPQRIVTLLPSITEGLCALGACPRIVGTDRFSNWPEEVKAKPKVGGLEDAQVERIVALKPDVVLASPSARVIDRLEGLGLKVLVIESNTHAQVKQGLTTLATLLGHPQQGAQLWSNIERELAAAAQRVPASMRGQRIYFEVDASPYAAGASSFIGETLTRLGLGNIAAPELGPFPRLNPEFVVRSQPQVLIAAQRNLAEMPRRPGWNALKALQSRRTCGFETERFDILVRPGPRMGEAARLLVECLQALDEKPVEATR
jgi:iron complex transport system substrate-binding protein